MTDDQIIQSHELYNELFKCLFDENKEVTRAMSLFVLATLSSSLLRVCAPENQLDDYMGHYFETIKKIIASNILEKEINNE